MLTQGITSMFIATLLSSTPGAKPPARTATPVDREVQIEIVERGGGGKSSVGFVVPVEGKIEAWVDRSTNARRCELEVQQVQSGVRLKLECSGGAHRGIRVNATRSLPQGTRVRIAEVTRSGGAKSQVFATLR